MMEPAVAISAMSGLKRRFARTWGWEYNLLLWLVDTLDYLPTSLHKVPDS